MRKLYVFIILFITIIFIGYKYVYHNHRDIKKENASYSSSALQISNEFSKNISEAETKYLNKTIEVTGIISEINETDLTLNDLVFCAFKTQIDNSSIEINTQINIKGRVIGYDDLLEQVKLDQCSAID